MARQLCFVNQRRPQGPQPYQKGMQGENYSYYHNNQSAPMQPSYTPTYSSWSTPPIFSYNLSYHHQIVNQPFQQYIPQQPQWSNPSQGWRPRHNQPPTPMTPPQIQPQLTHVALPRLPQIPSQPNPNPNNR